MSTYGSDNTQWRTGTAALAITQAEAGGSSAADFSELDFGRLPVKTDGWAQYIWSVTASEVTAPLINFGITELESSGDVTFSGRWCFLFPG